MQKMVFKTLSLALPALALCNVDVEGEIHLAGGYRSDKYKQRASEMSDSLFKKIDSATVELNGRMVFNSTFFFRSFGVYGAVVKTPELVVAGSATEFGLKKYIFDIGGAVGWQFDFKEGAFSLSPEFGYDYARVKFCDTYYLAVGAPFAGVGLRWIMAAHASIDLGVDYLFTGSRREIFRTGIKLTDGSFQGPRADLRLHYLITNHWSLGAGYRFQYTFSQQKNFTDVAQEKTRWTAHYGSIDLSYTF